LLDEVHWHSRPDAQAANRTVVLCGVLPRSLMSLNVLSA